MPPTTNQSNEQCISGKNVSITCVLVGLETLIAIVGAAAVLLAALLLLLAVQCCVTIRIRNKSKTSHCHHRIETDSLPVEPYATVEMNASSKTVPKLQQKTDAIELSENPSYSSNAFILTSESHGSNSHSLEDYRIGLSCSHGPEQIKILPTEKHSITESGLVRNSTAYSYQSVHSFTNEDNKEDVYMNMDEMTTEDGLDENHIYHQPFTTNHISTFD